MQETNFAPDAGMVGWVRVGCGCVWGGDWEIVRGSNGMWKMRVLRGLLMFGSIDCCGHGVECRGGGWGAGEGVEREWGGVVSWRRLKKKGWLVGLERVGVFGIVVYSIR